MKTQRPAFDKRRPTLWSANRPTVHQTTVGIQSVQTALQFHRTSHTYAALVDFAIVTDLFNDVVGPFIIQAQSLTHAWRRPNDALNIGSWALERGVDGLRRKAVFLSFQ